MWRSYQVSKVVHAQTVGVLAQGLLQIVQLDHFQVLLPDHPPPTLLLLQGHNTNIVRHLLDHKVRLQ